MSDATPTPPQEPAVNLSDTPPNDHHDHPLEHAKDNKGHPEESVADGPPKESAKQRAVAAAVAAKKVIKDGVKKLSESLGGVFGITKETVFGFLTLPLLIIRGDWISRILTIGFMASVALIFVTGSQLYHRFMPKKIVVAPVVSEASQGLTKFLEEEKKIAIMAGNVLFLERFSGSLDSGPGLPGVFEIELYVEADSPSSATVLRAHLPQAREMVSGVIQGRKYELLLTDDGKNALRRDILDAVNRTLHRWTTKGEMKKVYFTKFVMG